jgi:hypothetical protein
MHFGTLSLVILDNLIASSHSLHALFTDHRMKSLCHGLASRFLHILAYNSSIEYNFIEEILFIALLK